MRILAIVVVVLLVALPFLGCGGGYSGSSCFGDCSFCNFSYECCGSFGCTNATTDGSPRCQSFAGQCKLSP